MNARPHIGAVLAFAGLLTPALAGPDVPPGCWLPVRVDGERATLILPGDRYWLVVGSLAPGPGPYRVSIRCRPSTAAVTVPLAPIPVARPLPPLPPLPSDDPPSRSQPPATRSFQVPAGDTVVVVPAVLRGLGRRCQVYVERDRGEARSTVDDLVRTFDVMVEPYARQHLGRCADVDRDGRFTILLTSHLGGLGGCMRGLDFLRDGPGNRCDMLYLDASLSPGPHPRTLLAHEYAHAVIFSEHVLADRVGAGRDEEGWLHEALAHVVEDRHGFGWSNLDARVSAYLNWPQRYGLVVTDAEARRVARCPGTRGAGYLFLRALADRHGPALLSRLVRTSQHGTASLESATGLPFAELFRQATTGVALGGNGLELRRPLGERLVAGPRPEVVSLAGGWCALDVAGTAAAHVLLCGAAGDRAEVEVQAQAGANLQLSLYRLPSDLPRLELRAETGPNGACELRLRAHDAAVWLEEAAWERLVPGRDGAISTSYRSDRPAAETVRAWFGPARLRAGETRTSVPIELPADRGAGRTVFKVTARDEAGRRVSGWAVVD